MTTKQEEQIAKLNRFIINIQSLQEISVVIKYPNDIKEHRESVLKSTYFNIPFPVYLGNGSNINNMAIDLKQAIKGVTDIWITDAKNQIIKIVEAS